MSFGLGLSLVALSILANGFFAGVETGFTSARRVRLLHWARTGRRGARLAARLAGDREEAMVGAVVGNNVAVVAGTSIATALAVREFGESGELVAALSMAALNIVFGEILPKTAFRARPEESLLWSAPILVVTNVVLAPLRIAAIAAARAALWLVGEREGAKDAAITRESLLRTFAISRDHQQLDDSEGRLLSAFIRNSRRCVADVLTPMVEVSTAAADARVEDVIAVVRRTGHSRLPVIDADDRLVGLLLFRDLQGARPEDSIESAVRDVLRLTTSMGLDEALSVLTDRQASMAVVTGSGGRPLGILTIEDLLEPLVGEILDEHDHPGAQSTL